MSSHTFSIYIDGASRGNPGPAGAGVYITKDNSEVERRHAYLGRRTNNQAEYLALALALFYAQILFETNRSAPPSLEIISDSELLVRQMQGEYKVKNNGIKHLHALVADLMQGIDCTFRHVTRDQNTIADSLANQGADGKGDLPRKFIKLLMNHNISTIGYNN